MNNLKFKLQTFDQKDWGGLTKKHHLRTIFNQQPQVASKVMQMYFMANTRYAGLEYFLNKYPALYLEREDDFTWRLDTPSMKAIPVKAVYLDAGTTKATAASKVGINHSEFYMEFYEDYFFDVNTIIGENKNYPIQIKSDPEKTSSGYLYRCQLITGEAKASIPWEYIQPGKKFAKRFSGVESTMSEKGGKVNYSSGIGMQNGFSRLRLQDTVPGNMIAQPIGFTIKDAETGKSTTKWHQYRELKFLNEFMWEKDNLLYYSRRNKAPDGTFKNKGKSGNIYEEGAGLKEQIESANIAHYNVGSFSIDWLAKKLIDLSTNRKKQDDRHFIMRTGERGMYEFHKSMEDHASLFTPSRENVRIKSGKGNALSYTGQFMEYVGPNGVKVTIQHDAMKDDPIVNLVRYDGAPATSWEYDIMDVGTTDGEPNIRLVKAKGQDDILGYEPGLRDPYSPNAKMSMMANSVDGYTIHRMFIGGVMVKDPTRCMVIKPSILAGL